jgi:phospholipase/lecithinase/hemolysin
VNSKPGVCGTFKGYTPDFYFQKHIKITGSVYRFMPLANGFPSFRLVMAIAFALAGLWPCSTGAFNAVVAFGDSYTDTGNMPSSPPDYWNGRFSNGPMWIETFSQNLGFAYNAGNNYAVSGTETGDLGGQINNFPGTDAPNDVLFGIWSGNNDFGNHLNLGTSDSAWNTQINNIVAGLVQASDLLFQKGARNIVLFNQLDLTKFPFMTRYYSASFRNYIRGKITTFNSRLSAALPNLINTHPGMQVYLIDMYSDFNYLLSNAASYGFTQTALDALDDPALSDKSFTGPGSNYVYWDLEHPTSKTHSLIAGYVVSALPPPTTPPTIGFSSPVSGTQFTAPATISMTANVTANGWPIHYVSFYHDGVFLAQVNTAPYTVSWSSVLAGSYSLSTQVNYGSAQTANSGALAVSVGAPSGAPPPVPWAHQDIGSVGQVGSAYLGTNGVFSVIGSGADIWGAADGCHFLSQSFSGDGSIVACVTSIQNTDGFAKAGLMFRESLDPGARHAMQFITPANGIGFQSRLITNGTCAYVAGIGTNTPYWLKLQRQGTNFQGFASPDGTNWTLVSSTTISMSSNIYAGLAVTAHNNSALNTATFARVQVGTAAVPTLAIGRQADGTVQITLTGTVGAQYRCDASIDLMTWSPIATNINNGGTIQVIDTEATALPQRFYRGVLLR